MCSSSASFCLNQAGPQKKSMPIGKVLSLPFPMRVLLRRFWGEIFWMKVKIQDGLLHVWNGIYTPDVQDGGREAFHRLCALCVTRCPLSRWLILTATHGTWKGRCHKVLSKCQRFWFVDKEWYWFPPSLRNTSHEQNHGDPQSPFELFRCFVSNLTSGTWTRGSRAAACRDRSHRYRQNSGSLVQRCQWSRWTYDPTGPLTLKALWIPPPLWVPCTLKILGMKTGNTFQADKVPHDRWLSEEAVFLRDVAFLCKSGARQVPFSVSLSVRVPVFAGWIHETVTFPPLKRVFPGANRQGQGVMWTDCFVGCFQCCTLWHLLTWFSPLVLGSSKTEDSIHVESFQRLRGTSFQLLLFLTVVFVLQLLPSAMPFYAISVQEDEAQHPFGSCRPGNKNHGDARCVGLEGVTTTAGGLSLASSALRAGKLNGRSQGNNDKNPVVVTFPNRNTFELFGIFLESFRRLLCWLRIGNLWNLHFCDRSTLTLIVWYRRPAVNACLVEISPVFLWFCMTRHLSW